MTFLKKPTASTGSVANQSDQFLFYALLFILLWAPLPLGSNRLWAEGLLIVMIAALSIVWVTTFLLNRVNLNSHVWRHAWPAMACLIGVQVWVFAQTIPMPLTQLASLSPTAAQWWGVVDVSQAPVTLDPLETSRFLLFGCMLSVFFALSVTLLSSTSRVALFLRVLVFSGTCQAVFALLSVLSVDGYSFFGLTGNQGEIATGTYVNRNHFAAYLVICLSAGIGLLLSQLSTNKSESWRQKLRDLLQLLLSEKIRLRIYLALMVIALVLTRSRMGNSAFFIGLVITGVIYLISQHKFSVKAFLFLLSLLLIDALIVSRWYGLDKVVERLESTNLPTETRTFSNEYTLNYLNEFPLTGSGGGSFSGIFPNFQPDDLKGFWSDAHNDYLQFAVELGIPATLLLGMVLLLASIAALQGLRIRQTPLLKGASFACVMVIIWALMHSSVDFNFQIPANALTFMSLLALAFVARWLPRNERVHSSDQRRGTGRVLALVSLPLLIVSMVAGVNWIAQDLQYRQIRSEMNVWAEEGQRPADNVLLETRENIDKLLIKKNNNPDYYFQLATWYGWNAYRENDRQIRYESGKKAVAVYLKGLQLRPAYKRGWQKVMENTYGFTIAQRVELAVKVNAVLNTLTQSNVLTQSEK